MKFLTALNKLKEESKKTRKPTNTLPLDSVQQYSSPDVTTGGAAETSNNSVESVSSQRNNQLRLVDKTFIIIYALRKITEPVVTNCFSIISVQLKLF